MIKRNDKHNLSISIIDEEYKKFINIINKAVVAKQQRNNSEKVKEVLNEMTMYALRHFTTEEIYMVEFNYPEYQRHKKEHHNFSIRTIAYLDRVINGDYQIANEILEYLMEWLANHIQVTDKKYTDCFNKKVLNKFYLKS